jgi:hypothetical protein
MSLSARTIKASYAANGSNTTFAIPATPIVSDSAEVKVWLRDESTDPITVTLQTEGALNDYTLTGRPTPSDFHVNVEFNAAPANGLIVVVALELPLTQTLDYNGNNSAGIRPTSLEEALDRAVGMIQQLAEVLTRVPKLGITEQIADLVLPEPESEKIIGWNTAGDGLQNYTAAEILALLGSSGIPVGGDTGSVLVKQSPADLDADWVQYAFDGFSARFNATFTSTDLMDTLTKIINIQYTAPLISLAASGSGTIREKGDAVTASTLTATITKRSDDIAEVRFYDQTGATLLDTQTSGGAIPSGGTSTYNWTGSFTDNRTFRAEVDDDGTTGGPTTVSSTASFTFVYPYYVGAGAAGLSASAVAALTKRIITSTASRTEAISAGAGEVFYFAYPASYGALSSILDINGFETFPDWTLRTENITGLDATAQSYRIYEFNNPVVAGSYQFTFIR